MTKQLNIGAKQLFSHPIFAVNTKMNVPIDCQVERVSSTKYIQGHQ
jgi:hypothetical protein